jgi:hypothetical protein
MLIDLILINYENSETSSLSKLNPSYHNYRLYKIQTLFNKYFIYGNQKVIKDAFYNQIRTKLILPTPGMIPLRDKRSNQCRLHLMQYHACSIMQWHALEL